MATSTEILSKFLVNPTRNIMSIDYQIEAVAGSSSTFFELLLKGRTINNTAYLNPTGSDEVDLLDGPVYAAKLKQISIGCDSPDFTVDILNINDVGQLETYNHLYQEASIDTYKVIKPDIYVVNHDDPITNKLYLNIINNDSSSTNTIYAEVLFTVMRMKKDSFI